MSTMPKKTVKKKLTLIRQLVLRDYKKDFGIGPGILYTDEVTYTDKHGRGFGSPMFQVSVMRDAEKLIKEHVTVLVRKKE